MSATVIPGLMPRSRTSWRGSPAASRSCSPCQIGLTISATGRSGFGKASAGAPDGAMKSWAAPSMVNVAVKPSAIAIRSELQAQRLRVLGALSEGIVFRPAGVKNPGRKCQVSTYFLPRDCSQASGTSTAPLISQSRHRRSSPQRLMDTNKIVVHREQCDGMRVIFGLLRKCYLSRSKDKSHGRNVQNHLAL